MRRAVFSGAAAAAPAIGPNLASAGFPSEGDVSSNVDASVLGPAWFHIVQESVVRTILRASLVPDDDPDQFPDALEALIDAALAAIVFPDGVALATNNEHLQNNPPANKAATPAGVRAVRNALIGGAPGALDTLNELAEALNDDANAYDTLLALVNARLNQTQGDARYLRRIGGTLTGALNLVTPVANDDSKKAVNSEWVRQLVGEGSAVDKNLYKGPVPGGLAISSTAGTAIPLTADIGDYDLIKVFGFNPIGQDVFETVSTSVDHIPAAEGDDDQPRLPSINSQNEITDLWSTGQRNLTLRATRANTVVHLIVGRKLD